MNWPIKIFLGVLGSGVTAASGYGIHEFTRPKTIGAKLSRDGKEILGTGENDDKEDWKNLLAKYKTDDNDKFIETTTKAMDAEKDLRDHCKKVLEKELSKENEDDLKKAGYWCVKNSSKLTT